MELLFDLGNTIPKLNKNCWTGLIARWVFLVHDASTLTNDWKCTPQSAAKRSRLRDDEFYAEVYIERKRPVPTGGGAVLSRQASEITYPNG